MSKKNPIFRNIKVKDNEFNVKTIVGFSFLFILIVVILIIMPYVVSGNLIGSHISSDSLQVKQLAPEDLYVKRSFEYIDVDRTLEKKEAALEKVYPIFTYDLSKTYGILDKVENFTYNIQEDDIQGMIDNLSSLTTEEKETFKNYYLQLNNSQKSMLSSWVFEISRKILKSGYFNKDELDLVIDENENKISILGVLSDGFNIEQINISNVYVIENLVKENNLVNIINDNIKNSSIVSSIPIKILYLSIQGLLEPNVHYDLLLSEKAKETAVNNVKNVTVFVPANTRVLTKDSIISESDLELLKQVEDHNAIFSNIQIFARVILILLITMFSLYWFLSRTAYTFRRVQFTYIYLIVMSLTLVFSVFITRYFSNCEIRVLSPFLPVLFGTFFLKNTTNKKRFGFLFTIQYALYSTLFPGSTFFTFFYLSAIGVSFLYIIQYNSDRISRIISIFKGCVIAIFMTFISYAIQGYPFSDLYLSISIVLINILLCFVLERFFLPFVDNKLNIPTIFRLDELGRTDNKLLQRLKANAQGTYTHSVNVADLAYEAAKTIGVNADLCKVAALYHDVGKLEHPEYFTENQDDNYNKHDELTPSMSGSIIRSHVKLGVDLCKDEGLPKELIDIISEHHGNDVIQYFYNEAVKDSEKNYNRVELLDYTYNGNPPRSKESAIVMIADSVEAASHSQKTSAQKVGRLIETIVNQKLDRGQLNSSHLDLTELVQIEKALEQSLVGKLHTRVKYQNDAEKTNNKE
ncbi:MAG: HDIG domain-containing metalloprotein [Pleomorphochaeta sp.]